MDIHLPKMPDLSQVDWDFNASGSWPPVVKITMIVLLNFSVLGAGIYLDTLDQLNVLEKLEKKETENKVTFEQKQTQAANLQAFQAQLKEIEERLAVSIKQMPSSEEVANLLNDVSDKGISRGLQFKLFKPNPAVKQNFYYELPIDIEVIGSYNQFAQFISDIAGLSRIVTVDDIIISPLDSKDSQGKLVMKLMIKTYNEDVTALDVQNPPKEKPKTHSITKGK